MATPFRELAPGDIRAHAQFTFALFLAFAWCSQALLATLRVGEGFLQATVCLVNRDIGVRVVVRIGVRDGSAAKGWRPITQGRSVPICKWKENGSPGEEPEAHSGGENATTI